MKIVQLYRPLHLKEISRANKLFNRDIQWLEMKKAWKALYFITLIGKLLSTES